MHRLMSTVMDVPRWSAGFSLLDVVRGCRATFCVRSEAIRLSQAVSMRRGCRLKPALQRCTNVPKSVPKPRKSLKPQFGVLVASRVAEWFDWTKLSSDPNLPDSRRRMTDFLLSVRREHPAEGTMAFLEAIAAGRRVLDVGVVSPGAHGAGDGKWRHGRIAAAASYCLGVDILAPEVEELRRRGFNVVAADATSDRDLGERFDVVLPRRRDRACEPARRSARVREASSGA